MPGLEAPNKIQPATLGDYLEIMSKAVFQTGMSWRVIESKWPGIREALRNFDVHAVAILGDRDIDDLVQDTRVIRNRRKLEAIVNNARRMIDLEDQHGSFKNYLRSHPNFEATVAALRKDFKFLGNMGCYFLLYSVGEEVPSHEDWMASRQPK